MSKIIDLTGQRFGKLIVLEQTNKRYNRQVIWKCQCDCGNITEVAGGSLRSGHTKSCGCGNKDSKNCIDETGNRYGNLLVLRRANKKTQGKHVYWECQCDCGNTRIVSGIELRAGVTTSCHECSKEQYKSKNFGFLGPVKDYTNQRFGKLIALKPIGKTASGKILWQCKCDCGNYTEVSSNQLISGITRSCGCLKNHSAGEDKIEQLLKVNNIPFKKQFTFPDCLSLKDAQLRYDFAILDNNNNIIRLIEFDGEQHFRPVEFFGGQRGFIEASQRDAIKNQYAKDKQIPLVRIPYTAFDSMDINSLLGDQYLALL